MQALDYATMTMQVGFVAVCILIITVTYGQMRQHGVLDLVGVWIRSVKRSIIKLNYLCVINMGFANFSVVLFLLIVLDYKFVKQKYHYLI
jgi:hypothetical protein